MDGAPPGLAGGRLAGARNFRVLRSRPTQSETQLAFAAVGDLLAPALSSGVLQRLASVQRRALETALLIREPDDIYPDARSRARAAFDRAAMSENGPVLIALDDAQWLDASSVDVLTFMLRRLDAVNPPRSQSYEQVPWRLLWKL